MEGYYLHVTQWRDAPTAVTSDLLSAVFGVGLVTDSVDLSLPVYKEH
jgi:hypothetical protein